MDIITTCLLVVCEHFDLAPGCERMNLATGTQVESLKLILQKDLDITRG